MKWADNRQQSRRVIYKVNPAKSGGAFDRKSTLALQMSPGVFATLWRRPYQRPQPRTMPLWAALPVLVWLWCTGELA